MLCRIIQRSDLLVLCKCVLFNNTVTCRNYILSAIDEWMCMDHWWNDTDRGKHGMWGERSCPCARFFYLKSNTYRPGIETLFNNTVTCQNYILSAIDERMCMDYWWNDTDRRKNGMCSERTCPCARSFYLKSNTYRPGIETLPTPWGRRLTLLSNGMVLFELEHY